MGDQDQDQDQADQAEADQAEAEDQTLARKIHEQEKLLHRRQCCVGSGNQLAMKNSRSIRCPDGSMLKQGHPVEVKWEGGRIFQGTIEQWRNCCGFETESPRKKRTK